jgi:hypothetical protein
MSSKHQDYDEVSKKLDCVQHLLAKYERSAQRNIGAFCLRMRENRSVRLQRGIISDKICSKTNKPNQGLVT